MKWQVNLERVLDEEIRWILEKEETLVKKMKNYMVTN